MNPTLPVHRLAATELLYRASYKRRPFPEKQFADLRDDMAAMLADGWTVGVRAMRFGEHWDYELLAKKPRSQHHATGGGA